MLNHKVTLLGAGGHAKVVLSTLRAAGFQVARILDDNPELFGKELSGVSIDGPLERAEGPCVFGIGSNEVRKKSLNICGE